MGETFQNCRAAVNVAKGIRQFQKADDPIDKDEIQLSEIGRSIGFFYQLFGNLEDL